MNRSLTREDRMVEMDEILQRKEHTRMVLQKVGMEMVTEGQSRLENEGLIPTKVVAVSHSGGKIDYFLPTWEDGEEKTEVFNRLNQELEEIDPDGIVMRMEGMWTPEDEGEDETEALVVILQALGWGRIWVIPFEWGEDQDEPEWGSPTRDTLTENDFITIFEGGH